ncbi:MAG: hypothetical protein LBI99_01350, partial [Propionibacteriaceae bacterium]|nr:hypothetical protein [Propionibacteriaceae bacterium]
MMRQLGRIVLTTALAVGLCTTGLPQAQAADQEIHVAKTGSDSNAGTAASPYLTINKAAQEVQPGGTVIVHEGLYREQVKPARGGAGEASRITYTAAAGEEVVIKGSEEINDWVRLGGDVWYTTLPNSYFGSWNPYNQRQPQGGGGYAQIGNTGQYYNAGDVYLDETAYYQKGSIATVEETANSWYSTVLGDSTTIYANFNGADPNEKLAEINVRRQVIAPDENTGWGLGYITVRGFTIKQAAGTYSDFPDAPARRQAGAISVYGGLKWIIEQNKIINARTIAIDIGLSCDDWAGNRNNGVNAKTHFHDTDSYGSHIVRNNYIGKAGQSGVAGVFSWNSEILYNMIEDTNYRGEFSGAETAPIKVHYMNEGLIKGNYIKASKGGNSAGIWTD